MIIKNLAPCTLHDGVVAMRTPYIQIFNIVVASLFTINEQYGTR